MPQSLAQAIAQLEGVNPAYNNPGAISGTGDTGTSFGENIGIYSTLEAGQAALDNQLNSIYSGTSSYYTPDMTLDQFGSVYAPKDSAYGSKLANILGVPSSTTLNDLQSGSSSATPSTLSSILGMPSSLFSKAKTALNPFAGHSLEDFVVLAIGIILILVGAFAFKTTQTVIQVAGRGIKAASTLAE